MAEDSDDAIGYGKPPKATRFKKGQSGNPKGRPKGSLNVMTSIERALTQRVRVKENGVTVQATKLDVAIMQVVNQAASGNLRAFREMRELMSVREELCAREQAQELEASQAKEQAHAAVFQQLRHRFQQIQASSDAMDDSDSETA